MFGMEETEIDLGQVGYEAYGERAGWKTFDGQDMPHWANARDDIKDRWRAAAEAVAESVAEAIVDAAAQSFLPEQPVR